MPRDDIQIGDKGNREEDCLLLFIPEGELLPPPSPTVGTLVSGVGESPAPVSEPTRPRRRAPIAYPDTIAPTRPRPFVLTAVAVSAVVVVLLLLLPPDAEQTQPSLPPAPSLRVPTALSLAPVPPPAPPESRTSVATSGATEIPAPPRPRAVSPRATSPRSTRAVSPRSETSPRTRAATATRRPAGHVGTLSVQSEPQGANVFVNNEYAGQTPLVIRSLPAGSRAVRLRLDGYDAWSRGVRVVANQSATVKAQLTPTRGAP